jgi:hypothetical protein
VRSWDNAAYTPAVASWPGTSSAAFQTFDPLWSVQAGSVITDPAAGSWFSEQALMLAQNASPALKPLARPELRHLQSSSGSTAP